MCDTWVVLQDLSFDRVCCPSFRIPSSFRSWSTCAGPWLPLWQWASVPQHRWMCCCASCGADVWITIRQPTAGKPVACLVLWCGDGVFPSHHETLLRRCSAVSVSGALELRRPVGVRAWTQGALRCPIDFVNWLWRCFFLHNAHRRTQFRKQVLVAERLRVRDRVQRVSGLATLQWEVGKTSLCVFGWRTNAWDTRNDFSGKAWWQEDMDPDGQEHTLWNSTFARRASIITRGPQRSHNAGTQRHGLLISIITAHARMDKSTRSSSQDLCRIFSRTCRTNSGRGFGRAWQHEHVSLLLVLTCLTLEIIFLAILSMSFVATWMFLSVVDWGFHQNPASLSHGKPENQHPFPNESDFPLEGFAAMQPW